MSSDKEKSEVKAHASSGLIDLPSAFPSEAISDGISIITSGTIASRGKDLARDLWNVAGYGLYIALPGSVQPNDEQKAQLESFGMHFTKAHADINSHIAAHATSKKFGDGQLLKTILGLLPTILGLLRGLGLQIPTIPGLPTA